MDVIRRGEEREWGTYVRIIVTANAALACLQ